MILILYIILDCIYQFMIENKGKHSKILQDNLTCDKKIIIYYLILSVVVGYTM